VVAVRVTTLKGADAGSYYVEQLPNSASCGADLGRRYDDKSVRGFDVTASAPKSVSVLFAIGDRGVRREAVATHDAAVERWKLEREAAIDSRPAKARSVDAEVLHSGWAEQVRGLGHYPAAVVAQAVNQVVERGGIGRSTRLSMIDQTIVAMSEKQSTWRPTQVHRDDPRLRPHRRPHRRRRILRRRRQSRPAPHHPLDNITGTRAEALRDCELLCGDYACRTVVRKSAVVAMPLPES